MAREISRAEAYEKAHEIFSQVNFNAFDFSSIKESLLDYMKLYYPEDFNDYIESSEFIALLELFAYIGELFAYRIDVNAHENFITTAQRKESILRLAKLLSYSASRNIPARGLVKITSVQTTETVIDSQGRNLANRQIIWNDTNNADWKEQFLLVMNRVLEQEFGTVDPSERVQVDDVLFELYSWNNSPLNTNGVGTFPYSANVSGDSFPMELVPSALDENGPLEKRPERNTSFSLLYASDGLGDGSDTTGFMCFTKQGQLQRQEETFDGITPNQTLDLDATNINETDIFINNVDPDTREVLTTDPYAETLPHLASEDLRYGEWIPVDLANAQNILFNTNPNRHKYEVETLDDDGARVIFGDGEFSDIPSGSFDIWYRTSANSNSTIPKSAVVNQSSSFTYLDQTGAVQTLSFRFSLISSLQNGSASETIEHVRRVAPSVYYTQDRMVNGRDYNTFMLQDPSILKLRSVNRTFAGDSKYIAWHDPSEYYEDVKIFGEDAALYWDEQEPEEGGLIVVSTAVDPETLLTNVLEPLLCSTDFFAVLAPSFEALGFDPGDIRCEFNTIPYSFNPATNESEAIVSALQTATTTTPIVDIYYSVLFDEYTVDAHPADVAGVVGSPAAPTADSIFMMRVEARFSGSSLSGWDVRWRTRRLVTNSETTKFYNPNTSGAILNFNTLESNLDEIIILKANANGNEDALMSENKHYTVVAQELVEQNLPNAGLPDDHRLSVLPADTNDDNVPDNLLQTELLVSDYTDTYDGSTFGAAGSPLLALTLPADKFYVTGHESEDLQVWLNGTQYTYNAAGGAGTWRDDPSETGLVRNNLIIDDAVATDTVRIVVTNYVYFNRELVTDPWVPVEPTDTIVTQWALEDASTEVDDERTYKRLEGRYPLNFAWFHSTPRFHLVDPAASNIIDTFIITRGYYNDLVRYLENKIDNAPEEPTPLSLRTAYADLLENKMISDTLILHPGKFKILFGSRAEPELRAKFKIKRPASTSLTDNEVKVRVVNIIRSFFNIDDWSFGEGFYFTELAASIHDSIGPEIDSIVIVPTYNQNQFGDLFQIQAREDEIFIPDIQTSDVEIVQSFTPENLRQN